MTAPLPMSGLAAHGALRAFLALTRQHPDHLVLPRNDRAQINCLYMPVTHDLASFDKKVAHHRRSRRRSPATARSARSARSTGRGANKTCVTGSAPCPSRAGSFPLRLAASTAASTTSPGPPTLSPWTEARGGRDRGFLQRVCAMPGMRRRGDLRPQQQRLGSSRWAAAAATAWSSTAPAWESREPTGLGP